MNIFTRIANGWRSLFKRRRLSLQDSNNRHTIWYTYISPANLLMALITFGLINFVVVLTLVGYSPVLELLPGYKTEASRSRESMIHNILKIDSMERVINDMMLYNDNIALIMEGKTPVVRSSQLNDSISLDKSMPSPTEFDKALREEMDGDGIYSLRRAQAAQNINSGGVTLIAPIDGEITKRFDLKERRFGVEITAAPESRVEAAGDGVVMGAHWSPTEGNVVEIIHADNIITSYRHLSQSLIGKGDRVKAGEVIGYNDTTKPFIFELWDNGKPTNPESYIIF